MHTKEFKRAFQNIWTLFCFVISFSTLVLIWLVDINSLLYILLTIVRRYYLSLNEFENIFYQMKWNKK